MKNTFNLYKSPELDLNERLQQRVKELESELEKTQSINEQLSDAVTALRVELEQAKQERNAEGVRQRNIYLPQIQTHKAALLKAKERLQLLPTLSAKERVDAIAAINALLGERKK